MDVLGQVDVKDLGTVNYPVYMIANLRRIYVTFALKGLTRL